MAYNSQREDDNFRFYNFDERGKFRPQDRATREGWSRNRRGNRQTNYSNDRQGQTSNKPHTGATWTQQSKNGNPCISAWNYSRRYGLLKILIAPYAGSSVRTSRNGREWAVWMCKIESPLINRHFPVFVDVQKQMAVIRGGFDWVANCNVRTRKGGYCGQF